MRSYLLSIKLKITSVTDWVSKLKECPLYAIISGFSPDDVPGIGTFYDFFWHMWNSDQKHLSTQLRHKKKKTPKGKKHGEKTPNIKDTAAFRFLEEICGIPHGSGNTKEISDYVVDFAKKQGLRYRQDSLHNVILWKNGSTGYENSAPVILQGHLDMVCEKENNCPIDMEKEVFL